MIYIFFKDPQKITQKYKKVIAPPVIARLKSLRTALRHAQGINIVERVRGDEKFRTITRKIFNSVLKQEHHLTDSKFNLADYKKTVKDHIKDPTNNLANLQLKALTNLVDELLANSGQVIKDLLICPADKLAALNKSILSSHKIKNAKDKAILKLAFDYATFNTDIGKPIRDFYREANIAWVCPYCNIVETDYTETLEGETATTHFLDHFFDKASSPLLCYSLFNLVPSDVTCNSTNKSTINFEDKFHQNPHLGGFSNDQLIFEPIIGKINDPFPEIIPTVIPPYGDSRYLKMLGNERNILQSAKKGNINVFKIKTKYNRASVRQDAGIVLKKMNDLITSRVSLKHFLDKMKLSNNIDNYRDWYNQEFHKPFDEIKFHTRPYSKLYRDLHDYALRQDIDKFNDDIRRYI